MVQSVHIPQPQNNKNGADVQIGKTVRRTRVFIKIRSIGLHPSVYMEKVIKGREVIVSI